MALRECERADRAPANRSRAIAGARTSAFRSDAPLRFASALLATTTPRRRQDEASPASTNATGAKKTAMPPHESLRSRQRAVVAPASSTRGESRRGRGPRAPGRCAPSGRGWRDGRCRLDSDCFDASSRVGRVATRGRRIRLRFSPYSRQLRRKRLDPAEARAPSLRRLAQTLRRSAVDARSHRQTSLVCRIRCAQIAVKDQLRHGLFVSFLSGITQIGCLNSTRSLVKPPRGFLCSSCGHPAAHS